jgi:hypothetical protein
LLIAFFISVAKVEKNIEIHAFWPAFYPNSAAKKQIYLLYTGHRFLQARPLFYKTANYRGYSLNKN